MDQKRVLIVEDEEGLLEGLAHNFKYEGCDVLTAKTGTEGLKIALKQKPDLVILGTGPTETAVIVGQAAAQGFTGKFIGLGPTWNPALLQTPAAPALEASVEKRMPTSRSSKSYTCQAPVSLVTHQRILIPNPSGAS